VVSPGLSPRREIYADLVLSRFDKLGDNPGKETQMSASAADLPSKTADEKADTIIKGMVTTGVATGVIPLPLGIPFMAAVATGVVAIGSCYGVEITRDEAWKLIREFFKAAGFTFAATQIGWQFISGLMYATGLGSPLAVVLDTTQCIAISYAIGAAAKHYFSGQRNQRELGAIMRSVYLKEKAARR
jgi:uncharacterized protein (DUF697 family)